MAALDLLSLPVANTPATGPMALWPYGRPDDKLAFALYAFEQSYAPPVHVW